MKLPYPTKKADGWTRKLKRATMSTFLAKDILRESGTPMSEVQAFDSKEIGDGTPLSPIVRIKQDNGGHLIGLHSPFDSCTTLLLGAILSRAVTGGISILSDAEVSPVLLRKNGAGEMQDDTTRTRLTG